MPIKNQDIDKERFEKFKQLGDLIVYYNNIDKHFYFDINSDLGFKEKFRIKGP